MTVLSRVRALDDAMADMKEDLSEIYDGFDDVSSMDQKYGSYSAQNIADVSLPSAPPEHVVLSVDDSMPPLVRAPPPVRRRPVEVKELVPAPPADVISASGMREIIGYTRPPVKFDIPVIARVRINRRPRSVLKLDEVDRSGPRPGKHLSRFGGLKGVADPHMFVEKNWAYMYVTGRSGLIAAFGLFMITKLLLLGFYGYDVPYHTFLVLLSFVFTVLYGLLWYSPAQGHIVSYRHMTSIPQDEFDVRCPEHMYATETAQPSGHKFTRTECDVHLSWAQRYMMWGRSAITDRNEFHLNLYRMAETRMGLRTIVRPLLSVFRFADWLGRLTFADKYIKRVVSVSMRLANSVITAKNTFGVVDRKRIESHIRRIMPSYNIDSSFANPMVPDTIDFVMDWMVYDTVSRGGNYSHHFPEGSVLPWASGADMGGVIWRAGVPRT